MYIYPRNSLFNEEVMLYSFKNREIKRYTSSYDQKNAPLCKIAIKVNLKGYMFCKSF